MSQTARDLSKWAIYKLRSGGGRLSWVVRPPVGSVWGTPTGHDTGVEAIADFRRQTYRGRADD